MPPDAALKPLPVPLLVGHFVPDRERRPGPAARAVAGLGLAAIAV